jgi:hypothetical protein
VKDMLAGRAVAELNVTVTGPRVQASDIQSDLARAVAQACRLARGLALAVDANPGYALSIAGEIADAVSRATELDLLLDTGLGSLSADLANACFHAEGLARVLARSQDRVRVRHRVLVRLRIRDLESNLGRAGNIVGVATAPARRRVMPSAGRLLAAAVWVLPAADRARYADEYRSELWELAQAGAGRIRQLGYALRQLRSAASTGFALRSPRRRSAGP